MPKPNRSNKFKPMTAYREGFDAYTAGLNIGDNPYPARLQDCADWMDGWRAAEGQKAPRRLANGSIQVYKGTAVGPTCGGAS